MKLYRDLHIVEFLLAGTGAVAIVLPPTLRDQSIFLPSLLAFLWIVVCAFFFQWLAIRRLNKVMALLNECRVKEYVAQYEKLLGRARRKTTLPVKTTLSVKLNLSAGYIELGHPRKALELLRDLPDFPKGRSGTALRLVYDNNMAVCQRMLGDLDEAGRLLEQYRADLAAAPEKTPQRTQIVSHCRKQAMLLNMARGDFDGARVFFQTELRTDATERSRVADHYALAWVSLQEGSRDESAKHLEYVLAHGGDTWYVSAARERMRQLRIK